MRAKKKSKRMFSITIVPCLFISIFAQTQDYCANKALCPYGQIHISCYRENSLSSKCPRNTKLINIIKHRDVILRMHNERRNIVAGGELFNYPPAARMATIQWDDELALIATYHVKECTLDNNLCQSTNLYKNPGQILGLIKIKGDLHYQNIDLINYILDKIFLDHERGNMRRYLQSHPAVKVKGVTPFLQLVLEDNNRVGCAVIVFKEDNDEFTNFLLACKYATKREAGDIAYKQGPPGSECKKGNHAIYTNLCADDEEYGIHSENTENDFLTLLNFFHT